MLETLNEYRSRTGFMWETVPERGLTTRPGLRQKAGDDGLFAPFYGDTVIFALPPEMIRWLSGLQEELYAACGPVLAQKLDPDTFHITLHDLSSSPSGWPAGMPGNCKRTLPLLEAARGSLPPEVTVRSSCVFSMVDTSIVMGFEPAQESDCRTLMGLYRELQGVQPLTYPLTLHATLAYYRPGEYSPGEAACVWQALRQLGRERREWRLRLDELRYATFDSMNHYSMVE